MGGSHIQHTQSHDQGESESFLEAPSQLAKNESGIKGKVEVQGCRICYQRVSSASTKLISGLEAPLGNVETHS